MFGLRKNKRGKGVRRENKREDGRRKNKPGRVDWKAGDGGWKSLCLAERYLEC